MKKNIYIYIYIYIHIYVNININVSTGIQMKFKSNNETKFPNDDTIKDTIMMIYVHDLQ